MPTEWNRIRRELERRAREADDSEESEEPAEPDTGGTTSPVGGINPNMRNTQTYDTDSDSSEESEPDTGETTSPVGGVAPPSDTDSESNDSSTDSEIDAKQKLRSDEHYTSEPDTGETTSPVAGTTPPSDTTSPSPSPSPSPDEQTSDSGQTDDDFYDPTVTRTSPVAGEPRPDEFQEDIEGVSSSREADIKQNVADQYDNIFYNDVSLSREELSEQEIENIRRREAEERGVSPERLEFEQEPFRVVPEISEEGRERAAEVDIASEFSNVSPREIDVTDMSDGQAEIDILTEDAQAEVQTQRAMEAQDSSMSQADVTQEEAIDFEEAQQQLQDIEVDRDVAQQDAFGQTTDPNYRPGQHPDGFTDVASDAIGIDIEEAASTTGSTLVDRPVDSTVTGFETMARGAGIDFDVVQASEQTGETLVNRPIDSTAKGFEIYGEGIDQTAEDLEGGVGPGSAAVPAVVTGTSASSAVSTAGTGAATVGGLVVAPIAAGALGVRGVSERDDVTVPTPETGTNELPVQEPTTEVEEVSVNENVVQQESEIDVSDATVEEQPEIVVEEGTLDYTPEIEVDESTTGDVNEIPIGSETGTAVDQPTGGFEDLPREDYQEPNINEPEPTVEEEELPEDFFSEEEEGEIGEQFTQEEVSNLPLEEQQYLQEEFGRYEQTTGGQYVFPGEGAEPMQIEDYAPELDYVVEPQVGFGSQSGTTLIDEIMPGFGPTTGPAVDTDVMMQAPVETDTEFTPITETVPEMEFEYPTPEEPAFEYGYGYEYSSGNQNRKPRIPRLFELPETANDPKQSGDDLDDMFGFDINVGSYLDIL